eukprot:scaffold344_cov189-Alexandrium_tamarense.AAC.3
MRHTNSRTTWFLFLHSSSNCVVVSSTLGVAVPSCFGLCVFVLKRLLSRSHTTHRQLNNYPEIGTHPQHATSLSQPHITTAASNSRCNHTSSQTGICYFIIVNGVNIILSTNIRR